MKQTGILLPVSSLPSPEGVGELGSIAYQWIDILEENGITIWQILPLNPTGYGNSPYQPYSSYAGDEIYISLEELWKEGLLKENPIASIKEVSKETTKQPSKVDYDSVRSWKEPYLREACSNFKGSKEYDAFAKEEWVYQYGVYRALKKINHQTCWNEWPKEQMFWIENQAFDVKPYQEEIDFQIFLQYTFYCQWIKVKEYANQKNIKIMGDVPFYVGIDSVDVWGEKENFLLDAECKPTFIAGVPPDYFSETGQRWGNPIYNWDYMKQTNYEFWVKRIGYNQKLFDIIRIDHFRAFDTFWKIPSTCPTAIEGEWIEAPGYEVLDILKEKLPGIHLVAEDLGDLRPEVTILKEHYHLKGMKILQFTINMNGKYAFDEFQDVENMIVYTGTHDNATLLEWYESLSAAAQRKLRRWLKRIGLKRGSVVKRLVTYTLQSKAEYAIIPAFDILEEGASSRINVPGTVGSPNWEWRMKDLDKIRKELSNYKLQIQNRCK